MSTVVRGGSVVTPSGVRRLDISIVDEAISELLAGGEDATDHDETIDATGMLVLPGAIDAHTHFIQDDPDVASPTRTSSRASGTAAAPLPAAG